ncbi:MAG: S-adenosylmethionine:tRNA ribosyltransferase-isomerase [Polyangiales bacterium]
MRPATWPRDEVRMMVLDAARRSLAHARVADLGALLGPRDVLVVNDAATIPASLPARVEAHPSLELRLASSSSDPAVWDAVLFGAGDWRTRTELRPPPPALPVGASIRVADALDATVLAVSPRSSRLLTLRFEGPPEAFWRAVYAAGRPVQYAHLRGELPLWHAQTAYAGRPWAVELPSAGHPLRWKHLDAARAAGVTVLSVTHGAGLSATGDERLDAALPLPERYEVPEATARGVAAARREGGRVIAVGTSAVRALEGCAREHGELRASSGFTDLRVGASTPLRVTDAVLSGMHEPGTSHFELLSAFAPPSLLLDAVREGDARGYLGHEFGDACLVLAA